jgi:hypothetical protein
LEASLDREILALLVESYCGPDRRVLSCFRTGTAVVEGPIRSRSTGEFDATLGKDQSDTVAPFRNPYKHDAHLLQRWPNAAPAQHVRARGQTFGRDNQQPPGGNRCLIQP